MFNFLKQNLVVFLPLGKKIDTWFAMDPNTGIKQEILSFNKPDKTCPLESSDIIFIGRTGKYLGDLVIEGTIVKGILKKCG